MHEINLIVEQHCAQISKSYRHSTKIETIYRYIFIEPSKHLIEVLFSFRFIFNSVNCCRTNYEQQKVKSKNSAYRKNEFQNTIRSLNLKCEQRQKKREKKKLNRHLEHF